MSLRKQGKNRAGGFATTKWSIVACAGRKSDPASREALAALCEIYWYPLYAYIRRQGYDADEAQDLTQEFFTRLLEKDYLQGVVRERGKFRYYLLAAVNHFLSNQLDRARALKRGGGLSPISIDIQNAEKRYVLEPSHNMTPEKIFERRWALTLLEQTLARLRAEYAASGQEERFDRLKMFLTKEKANMSYSQAAAELGTTETTIKVAVHRLRRRYAEVLRSEIAQTLTDPAEVEDELKGLFSALGA